MADDRICGGNWWNSSRPGFSGLSSPCSTAPSDLGGFGWTEISRSCEEPVSISDSSMVFRDAQKAQAPDSAGTGGVLMDSTLQMAGFGLSQPMDWNQALLRSSGRAESNFHDMLQEDSNSVPSFRQETVMESIQVQKDWSPKDFMGSGEEASANVFKQINQSLNLDQPRLNSTGDCVVSCQGLPANSFSMTSAPFGSPSTLLQGLFDSNLQPQQAIFDNRSINYMNSNEFSPSWPKFSQFLNPSTPKQQPSNQLQFSNNTPFWNASATSMSNVRSNFYPFPQNQFLTHNFEEKPNCSNLSVKPNMDEIRDSSSTTKKNNNESAMKRPRIETPSPVPTFKVRKEKLGDRITALQQLVSPFGKTDTASVLFEAIDYIKFLHEQVNALSTPYMKSGAPMQHPQSSDKGKDGEGPKQDLRSRGLCLVPISSTYTVTNEVAPDIWTPTFGGSFR
ncbi:hypothetical protein AAC387_Pa06g2397 [Persea americana]|eukprot:TRINITY_DN28206_c1_g1_i1.p1 TRINITY_DN28206_c1_g1~~TRINITY_DN28206_c1_g1_i1.p1  ORF type:complete len:476 (+),score=63.73 TRINITY_DN28206_c1_g1_i1:84-1430(+)